MKIGFLLPANFSVGNPGNGVRAQANYQADALTILKHNVVRFNPWINLNSEDFDVIQFFQGGFAHYQIEEIRCRPKLLVFSPIIDSNESNFKYRAAAAIGKLSNKVFTIPSVFRDQALKSDLIICRSNYERTRVVEGLGIIEDKVETVLNGVNLPQDVDLDSIRSSFNLNSDFILHVSAYTQERKNVKRLMEAVGPSGYPMLIAGATTPGSLLNELKALSVKFPNIKLLGFLDEKTLNGLYAACRVFALPSIHEGTGLVALEAGSYGANIVITSNGGTYDYFKNFAEYVDPLDVVNIRNSIERAWLKPKDNELRNHILSNLTWESSARTLLSAYEKHLS